MLNMNEDRLKKFMLDEAMEESVHVFLSKVFKRSKQNEDINLKGARFMALEMLEEAWNELETYKPDNNKKEINSQIGL